MNHYSEIIKKALEEGSVKQDSKTNKSKNIRTMTSTTYSFKPAESLKMKLSIAEWEAFAMKVQEDITQGKKMLSDGFKVLFKLTYQILKFIAFLVKIIIKSIS